MSEAILVPLRLLVLVFELSYYYFERIFNALFTKKKPVKNEVVLITGAGSGIGRLISLKFVHLGCNVVGWDINEKGLEETRRLADEEKETKGTEDSLSGSFSYKVVDITKRQAVYDAAEQIGNPVYILINNAGVVSGSKYLLDIPDEKIIQTFEVNTLSHFWVTKAVLPNMLERNHGHIVTISSFAGIHGGSRIIDYCASKFSAVGFDDSLRWELRAMGKSGIYTTVVCPWVIDTGMFDGGGQNLVPYLLPILEPNFVADRIIRGILLNETHVYIPAFIQVVQVLRLLLPSKVWYRAAAIMGLDHSCDNVVGREKSE